MKRLTKIFASIFFIITVVTIYLAFDFAITNALSRADSTNKYDHISSKTNSGILPLKFQITNQTLKHDNDHLSHRNITNSRRLVRNQKDKQRLAKPVQFHKSKTGIKVNHMKNSAKKQRRKSLITTKIIHYNNTRQKPRL